MANKGQLTDYEKLRLLRIQENQQVLREYGVEKKAKALARLAESRKTKKQKVKPAHSNARDDDYIPEMGEDSDEDCLEVATRAKVAKKQHQQQYIAPGSVNKVVNLAKQRRVMASKVSDSETTKENRSKSTLTMGELISVNKGTRQSEVVKHNMAKPTCIKRRSKKSSTSVDEDDDIYQVNKGTRLREVVKDNLAKPTYRSKKSSVLDDEDDEEDDGEDDAIFQDDNEVDMEPTGLDDDRDGGYIVRTRDCIDQDDEYEDMDLVAFANDDDERQGDESQNDSEDEDVAVAHDHIQQPELVKATETSIIKKRGPTMLHDVHTRKFEEREIIICNEFGQPVGPVGKFSTFLGTLARDHRHAPLTCSSWKKVPNKDKLWDYVLGKYDVPDVAKKWVLETIGHAYKVHKCRFKNRHFHRYKDNATRWKNRSKNIPENDFSKLLRLWNNKDVAKRCLRAKEIRMSQKNMHTAGPKSFARIREEMKNEDPEKELPSLTQLFERTRKRTEGRVYLDTYDDTARKIERMKNYKPPEDEDGCPLVDPFSVVMNKEHAGYVRLYGKGVTKNMVTKLNGCEEPYMIPAGLMESVKASFDVEKTQLIEMRKEIEEDHQRKKADLDAFRKDIETQQANFETKMRDLMEKLPIGAL